jgi:hypothetical protein
MRNTLVIPAQAGIQRAKRKYGLWTPACAGVTRIVVLAAIIGAGLSMLPAGEANALIWKDCQRIAMCSGCRPVYKCRSCQYRRSCAGGICGWGDICVWGPYVRVLPRGARIIPAQ